MTDEPDVHPFVRDERLRKEERLLRRPEFQAAQRRGGRHVTPVLVVYAAQGAQAWTRLGLTVSRKVGGSVVRNRVKRRLREAFRRNKAALPLGFDVVVIARLGAGDADYESLERQLIEACGAASGRAPRPKGAE